MNIVTEIKEWLLKRKTLSGHTIGLVHTMGNLHAGHMSLIKRSQNENDITVAVIFINPTQFNQNEDFNLYPRTLDQDKTVLHKEQVDYLLLFDRDEVYADHYQIQISETEMSQELEGKYRPGHFTGMLTIVLKFLNLTQPTRAYYGEKDYQQLLLIKKMAEGLFLPTDIIACPTVRSDDNVPLSSRLSRLTVEEREKAKHFSRLLKSHLSIQKIIAELEHLNIKVDYVVEKWQRRLGAVWLSNVRLIDNILL